ncbi:hypothetical protein GCM10022199_25530 [Marihabitans asiaticum]|uniref:Uncharacterized protein n=1 Tax=Marihabitans asiaticum TaxID=415218 RepID=A0A560WGD0_9MICO|nr:hypothetical protein [Marihabitans asiaticum]TWD16739.1 hypothetical protein FB557_0275 [Marihabitans asiaticum]
MNRRVTDRFDGQILGAGSTSGVRLVVGDWADSPLGAFTDVMVATADGTRVLLAPSAQVGDYVSATYHFDEVVTCPVELQHNGINALGWTWQVDAGPLRVSLRIGDRTGTGRFLRALPAPFATSRLASVLGDPVARVLHPGVRTYGSAGNGRREYYGARDQHAVISLSGTWHGTDLGAIAPLDPAPDFGFSSAPRRPSLTRVRTTVTRPAGRS